jgi:hypothetical protein
LFCQSDKFIATWNFVAEYTQKIDSACKEVHKQQIKLRAGKSKIVLNGRKNSGFYHSISSKYRSGQNVVSHLYLFGSGKEIKIIEINGKKVAIYIDWTNFEDGRHTESQFVRTGESIWFFTYKNLYDNFDIIEKANWQN